MQNDSFEKFYYTKVGLGEGCGCAERIIDVHEFNRLAGKPDIRSRPPQMGLGALVGRLFARITGRRAKAERGTG